MVRLGRLSTHLREQAFPRKQHIAGEGEQVVRCSQNQVWSLFSHSFLLCTIKIHHQPYLLHGRAGGEGSGGTRDEGGESDQFLQGKSRQQTQQCPGFSLTKALPGPGPRGAWGPASWHTFHLPPLTCFLQPPPCTKAQGCSAASLLGPAPSPRGTGPSLLGPWWD